MKILKHIIITLFLLIVTNVCSQENTLQTIQKKYSPLLKTQHRGIGVLIKKNNKISTIQLGDYNLSEKKVFNIGSATKTFTAILILQEIEKGTLKLTDSIGRFLSPIKNVDGSLTIETLLSHESGLDEVVGRNIQKIYYSKDDALLNSNLLNEIEENHPKQIGKFHYCNTNYLLLGKIIEKVTDKNYFDLLRERIIEPLQMKNTYPYVSKNLPNLATPHSNGKDISEFLDYRYFATIANSAGSIASTLSDMEIFYTALFETELLLKKESLHLMMTAGNETYGFGLFKATKNDPYFGHGGNNIGYTFRNGYNPKTKNLYLLFATERTLVFKNDIKNDILSFFKDEKIEDYKTIEIAKFKKYTGKYLLKEANMVFELLLENNKLYLYVAVQNMKSQLILKSENKLIDTTVGATLELIEGTTDALTFSQNGFTTTINRVKK